ncbi:MAG TPA: beta-xylosidase [Opitutaceae bacterium]|nr:beta-xylosidase [Opitutaceae bacterium]
MKLRPAFLVLALAACRAGAGAPPPFPVSVQVDAGRDLGAMKPIWRFFGADEPNYATMKDGRKLLSELGALRPGDVFFRAHNLLNTGDGTPAYKWGSTNAYTEDAAGRPVYDWTIVDRIFDTYRARGIRPYVEIGFMPEAMSVHPEPYQHDWRPGSNYGRIGTGWSYPPKDYAKWGELVYQWVRHCVERYGRAEVERWWWEVWNEANGEAYWHATPEEFYKLHDYAVAAVRRALPTARVGGMDAAGSGGKFMEGFLAHVTRGTNYATGAIGTPTDFVSFHAKGSPSFVDGHVRLGIAPQLRTMDTAFGMIAAVPELKDKPIVIGESDPDGCAACQGPQLGYRNTSLYASYEAACFGRELDLAARRGVNLEGALTWAFEFEDQPYFAGQRTLAASGLDLPVLNVFRMLAKMGGRRIAAASSAQVPLDAIIRGGVRGAPDVGAMASLEGSRLCLFLWHYHDDDVPGPAARVTVRLERLPIAAGQARLRHYRIDGEHSNSYRQWQLFGSPPAPDEAQYAAMEKAGQLTLLAEPSTVPVRGGAADLTFTLPRQSVSLLELEW